LTRELEQLKFYFMVKLILIDQHSILCKDGEHFDRESRFICGL